MKVKIDTSPQQIGTISQMVKCQWKPQIFVVLMLLLTFSDAHLVGQKNEILLNSSNSFYKKVEVQVTQQKLQQYLTSQGASSQQNWFIFFDIQPADEVSWPDIQVNIYAQKIKNKTKMQHKKECSKQGIQLQTCYISSQDFNIEEETLLVRVSSDQEVKLYLFSEFMLMKKLQLNSCNKVDSSPIKRDFKLFKINIKQIVVKYDQIRIALTPINKIYGGQALHLYGSFGQYFPTPDNYDFSSFYAWEMGVLVRLIQEQLVEADQIYILADYPQNYLFDLDTTLIENSTKAIELKTGQFYDDVISGFKNYQQFIFTIQHPQLNNFIRIKKYIGHLQIENIQVIEYEKGVSTKNAEEFVTEYSNEISLSSEEFKIAKGIKKLQILVKTLSIYDGAVYTVQLYENSKEFNWIADGQAHLAQLIEDQKIYFASLAIRHQNQASQVSQAFVKITKMQGKTVQRIFVCLVAEVEKCFDVIKNSLTTEKLKKQGLVSEIQQAKIIQDGLEMTRQIDLTLNKSNFINYTDGYKQQIILVQVSGDKTIKKNIFSIEFMNVGILDTLTQHETKTQKFEENEFKIYRFTIPNDTQIQSLTFHVTTLYGFIQRFTTASDPSSKTEEQLRNMMMTQPRHYVRQFENNVEIEKVEPHKTYYLVIFAKSQAMASIKVQLKKVRSHPTDEKNISYSNFLINTISSYQLTFSSGQLIILDLNQITTPLILLRASALLPLDACINLHHVQKKQNLPLEPNCEFRHKVGKKYEIFLNLQIVQREIGLYNGNNQTVALTLSLENYQECIVRRLGEKQFFQAKMFSEMNTTQLCIKYRLYKKGSLIVTYKPKSPIHHRSLKLSFAIGKNEIRPLSRYETIIDSQELEDGCEKNYQKCYVSLLGKLDEQENGTMAQMIDEEIIFDVQYIDEPIDLVDGVSFTYMGPLSTQKPLRLKFGIYSIQEPVRLILQKQIGYFRVISKLVNINEHFSYPQLKDFHQSETGNDSSSAIYRTSNSMWYLYDIIKIPVQQLKKHCSPSLQIQHYRACALLISVFPLKVGYGSNPQAKLTIQAVQHVSSLKQSQPVPGYLEPQMLNIYEIQNNVENSTIIVFVNSNFHQSRDLMCLQMFARFGLEDRSKDQSTYRSKKGDHELIIQNAKKGTYTLSLKGVQSSIKYCDYMLQYSVVPPPKQGEKQHQISPIMSLKRSTPFRIQMTEKQTEYFMFFNHGKNANFKVLTLFQKLGQVLISVMPFATNQDQRKLITNLKDVDNLFKSEWKDSNSVQIYASDKAYCGECLYLIKLECLKSMKGSIIVPQEHEQIVMGQNVLIYDQLLKNQKSFYRLYMGFKFSINMKLISGAVSIKATNREDKQIVFSKNYTKTNEQIVANVQIQKNISYEYNIDWLIEIESQDDAHFVLSFKELKKQEEAKNATKELVLGVPSSIIVVPTIKQCVSGQMESEPTFIITSFSTIFVSSNAIQGLQFQFWVKTNQSTNLTQIKKENLVVNKKSNSLLLKVKQSQQTAHLFDRNNTFQLCFQTTQVSTFDIIQLSHVNFLPANADILIDRSVNFTFMAGDNNILEINECKGNSWISVSESFGSVHTLQSQINQIRRQNSLIEFNHKGPVFLTVQSDGIISINWKQVDLLKGVNTGYSIYQSGVFRILQPQSPNKKINLQILPLKESTLKTIPAERYPLLTGLTYEIYVQKQETSLNEAMNCHNLNGIKQTLNIVRYQEFNKKQNVQIQSIKELRQKFPNSEYVLITVKAMIHMKNKVTGQIQYYRFFYPYQEILLQQKDLRSVTESDKHSSNVLYFFIGIFVSIILIALMIFFCGKKIRNEMLKLRRKRIAQQENHFQMQSQMSSQTDKPYQKASDT